MRKRKLKQMEYEAEEREKEKKRRESLEKLIPFTIDPPPCPMCGSKSVKRFYATPMTDLELARRFNMDGEWGFLKPVCQTCEYEWGQKVKDAKQSP